MGWITCQLCLPSLLSVAKLLAGDSYPLPDSLPNPFTPFIFISHLVPDSDPADLRYQKGWLDLLFLAYHVFFYSFVRQVLAVKISHRIAEHFGVKKVKRDRFGEQVYAVIYFLINGLWGYVRTAHLFMFLFRSVPNDRFRES